MLKFLRNVVLSEKVLFTIALLISIVPLWLTKFIVTLDGPQHLYNSNVILEILKGNDSILEFFKLNNVFVGNWSGHFLLSIYNLFLPAWLAEKFMLTSYFIGMGFSFRFLIKTITGKTSLLSILVFPFSATTLYLFGYYNFSLAIIPLLFTTAYWIRIKDDINLLRGIIMSLFLVIVFASHSFVYAFLGLIIGVIICYDSINYKSESNAYFLKFRHLIIKGGIFLLVAIPSLVLFYLYSQKVVSINSNIGGNPVSFYEKLIFLFELRTLIGFNISREAIPNIFLFILLLIITIVQLYKRFSLKKSIYISDKNQNIWLILTIIFLLLYFTLPNFISAGTITIRTGILMFFMFITWLSTTKISSGKEKILAVIILTLLIYQKINQNKSFSKSNIEAIEVANLESFIEPNSTLYGLNFSNNWIHKHFAFYLGTNRPIINVKNPQIGGQFPVVYSNIELVKIFDDENLKIDAIINGWTNNSDSTISNLDYVFTFYEINREPDDNSKVLEVIHIYYELLAEGKYGKARLYKRKVEIDLVN